MTIYPSSNFTRAEGLSVFQDKNVSFAKNPIYLDVEAFFSALQKSRVEPEPLDAHSFSCFGESIPDFAMINSQMGFVAANTGDAAQIFRLSVPICCSVSSKALQSLQAYGGSANTLTGVALVTEGVSESREAEIIEDLEGKELAGIKTVIGVSLGTAGLLNALSVAKVAANVIPHLVSPMYLVTSFGVLVDGSLSLNKGKVFRSAYLKGREESFEKSPLKSLKESMKYLYEKLFLSEVELQEVEEELQEYVRKGVLHEDFRQELLAINDQLGQLKINLWLNRVPNRKEIYDREKKRLLSESFFMQSKEKELIDKRLERKKQALARRLSPACIQLLETRLEEVLEGLEREDAAAIQEALEIDHMVLKSNAKKLLLGGILILVALVGIAGFIIGSVLSGGVLPLVMSLAGGILWQFIDSSATDYVTEKVYTYLNPVLQFKKEEDAYPNQVLFGSSKSIMN